LPISWLSTEETKHNTKKTFDNQQLCKDTKTRNIYKNPITWVWLSFAVSGLETEQTLFLQSHSPHSRVRVSFRITIRIRVAAPIQQSKGTTGMGTRTVCTALSNH